MMKPYPPLLPLVDSRSSGIRQSHAQRRLWFLNQMAPESARQNLVFRMSLTGPRLEANRLAPALGAVVQRHSVLRTRYRDTAEGQEQWIDDTAEVTLRVEDLRPLAHDQRQQALDRILEQEQGTPFDLTRGPVLRARLVDLAADRQELIYTVHHIAFDGRSNEIFLNELAKLYAGEELPPVARQYADFAAWEPSYLSAERIKPALAFWRRHLADVPVELEFDGRPSPQGPVRAARHHFVVAPSLARRLRAAAKGRRHTLFTALLTLFGLWVNHLSGRDRFLVGTDVHGRNLPELADIMGFFVDQLTLKCDLSDDPHRPVTLADLLARTQASMAAARAHRELPFVTLVSALAPPRRPDRTPFFQVKLNYQRYRFPIDGIGEARLTDTRILQDMAGFDLVLDLTHGPTGIEASLEYDRQRFSAQEIERLAPLWLELVERFESLLDQPLPRIHRQLCEWENAHLQRQQQALLRHNRSRLTARPRRPQTIDSKETT